MEDDLPPPPDADADVLEVGPPAPGYQRERSISDPKVKAASDPDKLVQALKVSAEQREACAEALAALEAAAARSQSAQCRMLTIGAAQVVVDAMRAHGGVVEVQLLSCLVLQHLASNISMGGALRISEARGCEAITIAMNANSGNALLAQAGAQTLELIAFASPETRQRAVEDGALEALLSVLKVHRHSVDAQQAALAALQTLVERNPDCQQVERVAAAEGIALIITTLSDHRAERQVQYWGRLLLQNICLGNRDLKAEAVRKLHYQGIEMEL